MSAPDLPSAIRDLKRDKHTLFKVYYELSPRFKLHATTFLRTAAHAAAGYVFVGLGSVVVADIARLVPVVNRSRVRPTLLDLGR